MTHPDDKGWPSGSVLDGASGTSVAGNESGRDRTRIKRAGGGEVGDYSDAGNGGRSGYGSTGKVK